MKLSACLGTDDANNVIRKLSNTKPPGGEKLLVHNIGKLTTGIIEITFGNAALGILLGENLARITNDRGTPIKIIALEIEAAMGIFGGGVVTKSFDCISASSTGKFDLQTSYMEVIFALDGVSADVQIQRREHKVIGNFTDTLFELDTFNTQQSAEASEEGQIFMNVRHQTVTAAAANNNLRMIINAYYKH